jgi:UDP-N-acetylglucosamine diphosphorylase / glucose-1-phosphate thymidylyltransferase / UDP-N-acetylgalactosamine diphosphorylase / glucosamine-1-phosphate N-acetyltransferase / galactosamine-1-phosphate N-acetyltransferase
MLVTMKGLIPAAGRGTRLEPVTLAIPKELLIIGSKAVIEYVITSMKTVGITDITIIVGWRKHAILDYLGSGERLGVKLTYVVQDNRDGLAKAVLAGEHLSDHEHFLVVLGDNFFYPSTFLEEILAFHKKKKADATIGVAEVKDPTRHGIIKPGENDRIITLVEKPKPQDAPSTLGCIGIYLFSPEIFKAIQKTKPGVNGEYQLTDAIKIMIDDGYNVCYKKINGRHIDIGTMDDLKEANRFLSSL